MGLEWWGEVQGLIIGMRSDSVAPHVLQYNGDHILDYTGVLIFVGGVLLVVGQK